RCVDRALQELRHLVDAAIRSCVQLDIVGKAAGIDLRAGAALVARLRGDAGLAVEAFRQNPRQRRLADAARAREEVRVVQPLLLESVSQRADHVLLADQAAEVLRPPLARKYLIAHRLEKLWRALPPALAGAGCGCFLPDLTRFTRLQCGEARHQQLYGSETGLAESAPSACSQAVNLFCEVKHPPPSRARCAMVQRPACESRRAFSFVPDGANRPPACSCPPGW